MAGNRQAYEQAMNAGHSAAWDQDWGVAIASYGRAIQEFPTDADAHIHLGLGLLELGRLEDALKVYTRAHQLAPEDPIPLEKSADVLERTGRLREAAQQYISVSEVYLSVHDLNKAIENWERATRLTPGLIPIHAKLAQAYERVGDKKKAIREYLMLAYNFQRTNDNERALKAAQRGLKLEMTNPQVMNTIQMLEAGRKLVPPADNSAISARTSAFDSDNKIGRISPREQIGASDPLGPLGEAMTDALGALAMYVMDGNAGEATGDVMTAMEAQRQGFPQEAVVAYQRAAGRLRHPALRLNLGALLLTDNQPEAAQRELAELTNDPVFAAGALHGLGQAYHAMNKHKQGARFLLQSLQMVDSSLAADMSEEDELNTLYRQLVSTLDTLNEEGLSKVTARFVSMLQGKEWKQRIPDTRRQLEERMREEGTKGVVDILLAERGDHLTQSVVLIDRYMREGLYTLAMDEAHLAVEYSPNYLPVHVRMAEIMMREGRVRNAIAKYNVIAKTFLARGENDRAASILTNVLELAPLDVSVRESLIDLLESEERFDEALDQYIDLADTYHQLGNFDMSRDTYSLAERIASRVNAAAEKVVRIKHRIADIDQMRLDIRKAQKTYEEIILLAPDDERAHRMLVDLNYRQGNQVEAIRRLDKLLGIYARAKQVARIVQLLEELVMQYPSDTGLRSRLASIYRQLGRVKDATVQLDALGELQLEAGLNKDAAVTIRQIIALNPDGSEAYKQLLVQLGG